MTFFELVENKKTKVRRKVWPRQDYISLVNVSKMGQGVNYWDNNKFEWRKIFLTVKDFAADDWMEEK